MLAISLRATLALTLFTLPAAMAHGPATEADPQSQWAAVVAESREARSNLVNQGFSIENVVADTAYGFGSASLLDSLKLQGFQVKVEIPVSQLKAMDFPADDSAYHNYAEMTAELDRMVQEFPGIAHKFSLGRSVEGREMWALRINAYVKDPAEPSGLPGIVIMGGHHAREHLSMEVPRLMARHLLESYGSNDTIRELIRGRDIYFIPMVNPDGAEFDIADGEYRHWRKNRRDNGPGECRGVDLNRNYDHQWGKGGSSSSPCSDVYMGSQPFSEPETRNVKNFVESRPNLKMLLSLHTYSELILYPWGYSYEPVANQKDRAAFESMANTMAMWNKYTPQASSALYITTGDTVDWAYGALGLFAFTFELSPKNTFGGGGFYPGPEAIQKTFQANLRPLLYMIDLANDPYRAAFRPETTLFYGIK